jgi:hypothetical protein
MNSQRLATYQRFTLTAALLAQIAHTIITLSYRVIKVFSPHPMLHAGHLEYLPLSERLPWRLMYFCAALLLEHVKK